AGRRGRGPAELRGPARVLPPPRLALARAAAEGPRRAGRAGRRGLTGPPRVLVWRGRPPYHGGSLTGARPRRPVPPPVHPRPARPDPTRHGSTRDGQPEHGHHRLSRPRPGRRERPGAAG